MNKTKMTLLFAGLVLGTLLLNACGGSSTTPSPTTAATATSSAPATSSTPAGSTSTATPSSSTTAPLAIKISNSCTLPQPPANSPDSQNPPGDIPDSQVFVTYQSSLGGYQLQVPEGWARTTNAADASFVDKFDGVRIFVTPASSAPTAESLSSNAVIQAQLGHDVRDACAQNVQIHNQPAVLLVYTSNSDPNPVTGKQIRLENNAYLFYHAGKLATLILWAPLGADNVDQWKFMSRSFRWM